MNKKIFIIHGHDTEALDDLISFLNENKTTPIVIKKKASLGANTIMEKFEKYANSSVFAIALLTPDDKQAQALDEKDKHRARQNVILEMGWFMGKMGRKKIILVHKGAIELPSDIVGISYIKFQDKLEEIHEKIKDELIAQGLI